MPLGDGVDVNDKPFLPTFPYLAAPDVGLRLGPVRAGRAAARRGPRGRRMIATRSKLVAPLLAFGLAAALLALVNSDDSARFAPSGWPLRGGPPRAARRCARATRPRDR